MIFEHSKYFFAKDNARHRGVDVRESMEDAIGVKSAVGNEAVDVWGCHVRRSPKVWVERMKPGKKDLWGKTA